jgi:hypothetical protein
MQFARDCCCESTLLGRADEVIEQQSIAAIAHSRLWHTPAVSYSNVAVCPQLVEADISGQKPRWL